MSTPKPLFQLISIFEVKGGTQQQRDALMGCSFSDSTSAGGYFFYDKHGKKKSTAPDGALTLAQSFTFVMDGLVFTLYDFVPGSDPQGPTISGRWQTDTIHTQIDTGHGITGEDDLTFQAQAGGHIDYEAAASANA